MAGTTTETDRVRKQLVASALAGVFWALVVLLVTLSSRLLM